MSLKPEINEAQTEGGGLTVKLLVMVSMAAKRNEAQSEWVCEWKFKKRYERIKQKEVFKNTLTQVQTNANCDWKSGRS